MPNYWTQRFLDMEQQRYLTDVEYLEKLEKHFNAAERQIRRGIEVFYNRFADNNEISYNEAMKILNSDQLEEFKWTLQEYIEQAQKEDLSDRHKQMLENVSLRQRIRKLEAAQIEMRHAVEVLYSNFVSGFYEQLEYVAKEMYGRTTFEFATIGSINVSMRGIDTKAAAALIKKPWAKDGKVFSDRIWAEKDKLVNTLDDELTRAVLRGEDRQKAINNISRKLGVSKSNAGRLVMTESAAIGEMVKQQCFEDLDVEKYEIVATLDTRTSDICRELDGEVFDMDKFRVGVTAPPFHPRCRSTTAPYIEGLDTTRAYRGEDGKTHITNEEGLTYSEWAEKYMI